MRCLGPQKLAALLQPFIQRIEVRKGGHELPKPMAGVAHILLNLTFLPPCRGIAELRVKDIMAGHRKEPCVYIALLSDANPVDGCLHVVHRRHAPEHPQTLESHASGHRTASHAFAADRPGPEMRGCETA